MRRTPRLVDDWDHLASLTVSAVLALTVRFAGMIPQFLLTVYVTREYKVTDAGYFFVVLSSSWLLSAVLSAGLPLCTMVAISSQREDGDPMSVRATGLAALRMAVGILGLAVVFMLLTRFAVAAGMINGNWHVEKLAPIALAGGSLVVLKTSVEGLKGLGATQLGLALDRSSIPFWVLLILSVARFGPDWSAKAVLGGAVAAGTLVASIVSVAAFLRRLPHSPVGRSTLRFGDLWQKSVFQATNVACARLPVVILPWLIVEPLFAGFSVPFTLTLIVRNAGYALFALFAPRLAAAANGREPSALKREFAHAWLFSIVAGVCVALTIIALGKPLLSLYGAEFSQYYDLLVVLAVAATAKHVFGFSCVTLIVSGYDKYAIGANMLGLLAFTIGSAALTGPLQLKGIAISYLVASYLRHGLAFLFVRKFVLGPRQDAEAPKSRRWLDPSLGASSGSD